MHQVVKTRVQLQKQAAYGGVDGGVVYKNSFDAAVRIWKEEGPRAFFKGLVPRWECVHPLPCGECCFVPSFLVLGHPASL